MYHFALGQLLFVEASRSKGCGKLTVTGQLGEVMLESVRTAMLGDPSLGKFVLDSSWKLLMLVEPCCLCRQIMVKLPTHSRHFKSIVFLGLFLWRFCGTEGYFFHLRSTAVPSRSLLRSRIYYAAWGNERPRAVDAPLTPMRHVSAGVFSRWLHGFRWICGLG